jgi:hypothetical protein
VVGRHLSGQLALDALVVALVREGHAGEGEGVLQGAALLAPGDEEPQPVPDDRPAEGRLVGLVEVALALDVPLLLERRAAAPRRVREVRPEAAGEPVAAPLRGHVDRAAAEAPELGGDAGGEHLRLLDRVLDEDVVRRAERAVGHVHAVDEEEVVVGEAARHRDLPGVRRVVGEPGRELGDRGERAAGGERVDLAGLVGRAGLGGGDHRRRLRDDRHLLGDLREA